MLPARASQRIRIPYPFLIIDSLSSVAYMLVLSAKGSGIPRGGGGTPLTKWRGCSSYHLGDKICELVPLRVVKPKRTPAGVVAVPFGGL